MKKNMAYRYVYAVYANNMCYGVKCLGTYLSYSLAEFHMHYFQAQYGCCEIRKKREYI